MNESPGVPAGAWPLPEEPARSSQICGYQTSYTTFSSRASYCGESKAPGKYFCTPHHDWVALDGPIRMAPGNAIGVEPREES